MMNKSTLIDTITGNTTSELKSLDGDFLVHYRAFESFKALQELAGLSGFDMSVFSSFRGFQEQLSIWNNKATGKRDLLDDLGVKKDFNSLSEEEVIFSILRWSALPGMSRHHWGSDIDVIDQKGIPHEDYKVELVPDEVNPGGIFGEMNLWLDQLIKEQKSFGFFRPYENDLGGVAPEKWHLSFHPVSHEYLNALSFELFKEVLESELYQNLEGLEIVKKHAELIYQKYVANISNPTWMD